MAEILATIVAYAEDIGTILGAIKTGSELVGGFTKPKDVLLKKVLEDIARTEANIIDAIHTAFLNEHITQIADATLFWNDAWLEIINAGITYENIGPNGVLHGTEDDMTIKRDDVGEALLYFQNNPLPTTPRMLDILLGGYTLKLSMDTVSKAFTSVRRRHQGITSPPEGMKELTALLKAGQANVGAWMKMYQEKRVSEIGYIYTRELASDETKPHPIYDWTYYVNSDLGGDSIIPEFKQGQNIGTIFKKSSEPPDDKVKALVARVVERAWRDSETGMKAVDAAYKQWSSIEAKVTELTP